MCEYMILLTISRTGKVGDRSTTLVPYIQYLSTLYPDTMTRYMFTEYSCRS